jgi:hypothetical protein
MGTEYGNFGVQKLDGARSGRRPYKEHFILHKVNLLYEPGNFVLENLKRAGLTHLI